MSEPIQKKQLQLTEQLHIHLDHSVIAYRNYIQGGKTYKFAKVLKLYNQKVLSLLIDNTGVLHPDLHKDMQALITHYTVWSAKWEALQQKYNPDDEDEFVFQNEVTFPKDAAQRLEQEYHRLKELRDSPY